MKHYFIAILNTTSYETYYSHDTYENIEDIKNHLDIDERLIAVWEVGEKVY